MGTNVGINLYTKVRSQKNWSTPKFRAIRNLEIDADYKKPVITTGSCNDMGKETSSWSARNVLRPIDIRIYIYIYTGSK